MKLISQTHKNTKILDFNFNNIFIFNLFQFFITGAALNSMLELFEALVQAGIPNLDHRELLAMLIHPVSQGALHKQAYHSLAKCAAALTITWHQEAQNVVENFLKDIQNPQSNARYIFALLVIGEIGRHV